MKATTAPSAAALERASDAFERLDPADTSPTGRRIRAEARHALFEALVADGWEPDALSAKQAELDALTVRRTAPTAGTPAPRTDAALLHVA